MLPCRTRRSPPPWTGWKRQAAPSWRAVEASPAKAKQVRRFANYYLPDAVNILQQYATLARQGVEGENAAAIRTEGGAQRGIHCHGL